MKNIKKLLCLALALALVLSLTGCEMLDDLRDAHAVWTEDGNILWGGTEYIQLPPCDELGGGYYGQHYYVDVNVTEPDVPVLLSTSMGEHFSADDSGIFLWNWDDDGRYCHEDCYEDVLERVENGAEYTDYRYIYFGYKEDRGEWGYIIYTLAAPERDAFRSVLESEPLEAALDLQETHFEYSLYVDECSADGLFVRNGAEILIAEDGYYVMKYDDVSGATSWEVPEELEKDFDGICSAYLDAMSGETTVVEQ